MRTRKANSNIRRWYTSLLGCKSSLKPLIQHLRDHHIYRIKTTQLLQGKTTRWVIAWSLETEGMEEQLMVFFVILLYLMITGTSAENT